MPGNKKQGNDLVILDEIPISKDEEELVFDPIVNAAPSNDLNPNFSFEDGAPGKKRDSVLKKVQSNVISKEKSKKSNIDRIISQVLNSKHKETEGADTEDQVVCMNKDNLSDDDFSSEDDLSDDGVSSDYNDDDDDDDDSEYNTDNGSSFSDN